MFKFNSPRGKAEAHNLSRYSMGSLCLLSTRLRGTPRPRRSGETASRWDGSTTSLESAHRALGLERQCLVPYIQPSRLTSWTLGLGFSLGALTISGRRGPGFDLLREW